MTTRYRLKFDDRRNPVIVDTKTGRRIRKPFATVRQAQEQVDEMNRKEVERE